MKWHHCKCYSRRRKSCTASKIMPLNRVLLSFYKLAI